MSIRKRNLLKMGFLCVTVCHDIGSVFASHVRAIHKSKRKNKTNSILLGRVTWGRFANNMVSKLSADQFGIRIILQKEVPV